MKKLINLKAIFALAILSFVFTSCDDNDYLPEGQSTDTVETPALKSGSADFSNYVAIGGSITAGYTDGALFMKGQMNSSPNLMAQKFSKIGGGAFTTPMTNDNIGGLLMAGNVIQEPRLFFDAGTKKPKRLNIMPANEITMVTAGPFNNMGIPGAKSFHLLAPNYGNLAGVPTGQANPYFARFASSAGTSVMADAISQSPTFFSLWIGGNDVLSYSLAGGAGTNQLGNMDPTTYDSTDITDPTVFASVFSGVVDNLVANGSKGVLLNIPYVTSLPYFTTVPYAPLSPVNPQFGPQIPTLNATFAPLNGAFDSLGMPERKIVYSETEASPILIHDESLVNISAQLNVVLQGGGLDPLTAGLLSSQYGQSRQANEDDLIVLPSSGVIATLNQTRFDNLVAMGVPAADAGKLSVNGITFPMEDQWVMTLSEQMEVKTATDAFNATIEGVSTAKGLAFVDANQIMQEITAGGLQFDEFTMKGNLVFGNTFSLDGVHPTARGNAFIANKMLMAIDKAYGSNFMESDNMLKAVDFKTNYPEVIN